MSVMCLAIREIKKKMQWRSPASRSLTQHALIFSMFLFKELVLRLKRVKDFRGGAVTRRHIPLEQLGIAMMPI